MSTTIHNYRIPEHKMGQFHEILCRTGGRYLRNPILVGNEYRVDCEPGDYIAMCEAWNRVTTSIREVDKSQWWRRWLRRIWIWFLTTTLTGERRE